MDEKCCSQIDDLAVRDGNIWAKLRSQSPYLFIFGALLYIIGDFSFDTGGHARAWSMVAAIFVPSLLAIFMRHRRHRRSRFNYRRDEPHSHPWTEIVRVDLIPIDLEWHQLKVRTHDKLNFCPIDTDVRCTPEQANQIRSMVKIWRAKQTPTPA